ncbi:hypothetical protein [Micromonospora sp. NPDC047074]|uniref:hypothetical protein n=1 Tax=Micromonospora sp. NPDC047074 TaxID=3154339 RepID=UPI0033FBB65D
MRVDDIRGQLRKRGVSGVSALRKPELVKTLARTLRSERPSAGAARRGTGPAGRAAGKKASAGRATTTSARRAAATKKAAPGRPAGKAAPGRAQAAKKAAPGRAQAAKQTAAAKKAPAAKRTAAAKKAPAAKRTAAAKKAPARRAAAKAAPARKSTAAARTSAASSRAGAAAGGTATRATGIRTGRSQARSVRSSQVISSISDRPERPGRSLVTTNHDVIQRWARERGAKPATIAGTEREGRAGVLTFNMPGYRESSRVREITWEEWFRTFDGRKLNLIYQEQLRDGRQSNFFRTESPDREDA